MLNRFSSDFLVALGETRWEIEEKAIQLATLNRLRSLRPATLESEESDPTTDSDEPTEEHIPSARVQVLVENRFMDLACTEEGEQALESIFVAPEVEDETDDKCNMRCRNGHSIALCLWYSSGGPSDAWPTPLNGFASGSSTESRLDSTRFVGTMGQWQCSTSQVSIATYTASQVLTELIWK